ncbi:MAG: transporter [Herminiimonas sp.]|nr:transporter [Herminiimonas sp.]
MTKNSAPSWLFIAIAGSCATLIGLALGRFSYVPLLPLLIDAHWTSPGGAAQLAAANLIGYLVGALAAHRIALKVGPASAIKGALLAVVLSLAACGINAGLAWLWAWRFIAGAAGGLVMILSAPYVLSRVPVALRGKTAGMVFCGIGCGIMLSGVIVPAFGAAHLGAAWLALAAIAAIALLYAWPKFHDKGSEPADRPEHGKLVPGGALLALLCAYVLDAVGYIPHTVFWVEYLVHGLHKPLSIGGAFWVVFGAGAVAGPLLSGYAADRFGFRNTLIACFALKAMAVALPLASSSMFALFASSFVVGALTPGLVAVLSGRVIEIVGVAQHQRSWALLTFSYAVLQAAGGYAMAALYAATHSFTALFAIGASALGLGALILLLSSGAGFGASGVNHLRNDIHKSND